MTTYKQIDIGSIPPSKKMAPINDNAFNKTDDDDDNDNKGGGTSIMDIKNQFPSVQTHQNIPQHVQFQNDQYMQDDPPRKHSQQISKLIDEINENKSTDEEESEEFEIEHLTTPTSWTDLGKETLIIVIVYTVLSFGLLVGVISVGLMHYLL